MSSKLQNFQHKSRNFWSRKRCFWTGLVVLIILTAIAIPVGVMFGREKKTTPRSSVLVPLYVYPYPGAWDPLYTAIASHPKLQFIVVVNPHNGPGAGSLPDGNYTREIPRLNSHANVQTAGYVSTDYGKRDTKLMLKDVDVYSNWSSHSLGMDGIFLDEVPTQYNFSTVRAYEQVSLEIRSAPGLGPDSLIIHNPGTIPDARYLALCNMTIVFEGSYDTYQQHNLSDTIKSFCKDSGCVRNSLAVVVHSVPPTIDAKVEKSMLKDVRKLAAGVFITSLSTDYYSSFGQSWGAFVQDADA
ncbi:Spherulation-specific family 4 [Calycina marina]|uniref:Spherulation-specific family 4 n=1 Tax=Calycina marina TaxID=1763456 RepID=A0A9P7Z097_9HELO|nr:Spherulation-specific family 4 [Calycina marina]